MARCCSGLAPGRRAVCHSRQEKETDWDSEVRAIEMQLWSGGKPRVGGRGVDLDFETVQVSWAAAVEAKLKSKTKPKACCRPQNRLNRLTSHLLSLGHRWRLVLSPIKRSLTAIWSLNYHRTFKLCISSRLVLNASVLLITAKRIISLSWVYIIT